MKKNREMMRQAYLDGELSVSEVSEFEATLDEAERERLAAEVHLENGLAERLAQDAKCPDDVWERTKALVAEQHAPARPARLRRWYWGAATLAAASVAFFVANNAPTPAAPSAIVMAAESVEDLAATAECDASREVVQAYLHDHDVELKIGEIEKVAKGSMMKHYGIEILGARSEELPSGKRVVEILFGCCEYPVKVLMAEKGSDAAIEIGEAAGAQNKNHVLTTRTVDGYIAALVGRHQAHGLLDIFGGQYAMASGI